MATKRMFSKTIICTTKFLKMSHAAQNLYVQLCMNADDDGIVEAYQIMLLTRTTTEHLEELVTHDYVHVLNDDYVSYIDDWLVHNTIDSRYKRDSTYQSLLIEVVGEVPLIEATTRIRKNVSPREAHGQHTSDPREAHETPTRNPRKDKISIDKDSKDKYIYIVDYLNEKAGTHFKPNTAKTKSLINARLKEGFTVEDFKTVIDKKVEEWKNDVQMSKYIRPETLFGTKFEGYLNAKSCTGTTRNRFINFQQRETGQTEDELENLLLDNKNVPQ